jgi:hypothetical protein
MSEPIVHINAWEAAGLIDASLAERLRQAVAGTSGETGLPVPEASMAVADGTGKDPTSAGSFFGPSVTIGEMFGYLGAAFLLGAWIAFLGNAAQPGNANREAVLTGGLTLAALALFGLGVFLAGGDRRRRRGAGIAFVMTTTLAAGAAAFLVQMDFLRNSFQDQAPGILIAIVAAAVAAGLRRLLPAVTTQFGLIAALAGLAGAILAWFQELVYPVYSFGAPTLTPTFPPSEPVGLLLAAAAWWLLVGLGLGMLGMVEARHAQADPGAGRRAAITRFWAGLVAVAGVANALTQTGNSGGDSYGRVLEPWIADLAIVGLAAVLVTLAFRRDSNAFILSGAIGLIVALTDFNFSYLAQSTYIGLLIEGAILLAIGFAGDRLRRRFDRSRGGRRDPLANP